MLFARICYIARPIPAISIFKPYGEYFSKYRCAIAACMGPDRQLFCFDKVYPQNKTLHPLQAPGKLVELQNISFSFFLRPETICIVSSEVLHEPALK